MNKLINPKLKLVAHWKGLEIGDKYVFGYKDYVVYKICDGDLDGYCLIKFKEALNVLDKIMLLINKIKAKTCKMKR